MGYNILTTQPRIWCRPYCCVPECKSIYLGIHLIFNEIPHQESHKESYHALLTKIRRDPGSLITTSLIEKCRCQLQGQLNKCGQYAAC